jgi:hypothetical protein
MAKDENKQLAAVQNKNEVTILEGETVEKRRADYNRLVRTARLGSIILEKVDFKVASEALGVSKALLKRTLDVKSTIMSSESEDGSCIANIVWSVQYKFKSRAIVKCTASYVISYDGVLECSEDTVKVFVENVAKVATYAYFRALYAHLDWSATVGSPPLPIIQLQPKL